MIAPVTCYIKVLAKLKGKNAALVKPVMTYVLETSLIEKMVEKKLDAAVMKMLGWMLDKTRLSIIRNKYMKGSLEVVGISKKMQ